MQGEALGASVPRGPSFSSSFLNTLLLTLSLDGPCFADSLSFSKHLLPERAQLFVAVRVHHIFTVVSTAADGAGMGFRNRACVGAHATAVGLTVALTAAPPKKHCAGAEPGATEYGPPRMVTAVPPPTGPAAGTSASTTMSG